MATKIAIVGLGPSGIYCLLTILNQLKKKDFDDFSIDIFEKNSPLITLLPTGNGRCNITNKNLDLKNYPRGKDFLKSIFSRYSNDKTLAFLSSIGIKTYVQDDNRIFPISNSSKDVKDKFLNKLKKYSNYKIIKKEIKSSNELENYDYIVISAGSKNTDNLIKSFNHNLIPFKKALVSIDIEEFKGLNGVTIKTKNGDFVFKENGITGPLAFKISSINAYNNFPYKTTIDLIDIDELLNKIKQNPKKEIGTIISSFIPKSFAHALIKDYNYNKKASEISKKDLLNYARPQITVTNHNNTGEIVNAGGVDLKELDKNCKSKINNKLYFIGEILDIDGFTGGYNLQNCWSTGYVAGYDIAKRIINGK